MYYSARSVPIDTEKSATCCGIIHTTEQRGKKLCAKRSEPGLCTYDDIKYCATAMFLLHFPMKRLGTL